LVLGLSIDSDIPVIKLVSFHLALELDLAVHTFLTLPLLENETEATRLDMMNAYIQEYLRAHNSFKSVSNNKSLEKIQNKMIQHHSWDKEIPPPWLGGHHYSGMIG
jgi:hypothetical protein